MGENEEVLFETWGSKLKGGEEKGKSLKWLSAWKKKYFILIRRDDKALLHCYDKKPNNFKAKPNDKLEIWPEIRLEKRTDLKGRDFAFDLTTTQRNVVIGLDDEKIFHLFVFFLQTQIKLKEELEEECYIVRPDNSDSIRKLGARGNMCLLHISEFGVTLALQTSKCVLAQWPLKCIKTYESTGRGQLVFETGRRSPMGPGLYIFNMRSQQDNLAYDQMDHYIMEAAQKNAQFGTISMKEQHKQMQTLGYALSDSRFIGQLRRISRNIYDHLAEHLGGASGYTPLSHTQSAADLLDSGNNNVSNFVSQPQQIPSQPIDVHAATMVKKKKPTEEDNFQPTSLPRSHKFKVQRSENNNIAATSASNGATASSLGASSVDRSSGEPNSNRNPGSITSQYLHMGTSDSDVSVDLPQSPLSVHNIRPPAFDDVVGAQGFSPGAYVNINDKSRHSDRSSAGKPDNVCVPSRDIIPSQDKSPRAIENDYQLGEFRYDSPKSNAPVSVTSVLDNNTSANSEVVAMNKNISGVMTPITERSGESADLVQYTDMSTGSIAADNNNIYSYASPTSIERQANNPVMQIALRGSTKASPQIIQNSGVMYQNDDDGHHDKPAELPPSISGHTGPQSGTSPSGLYAKPLAKHLRKSQAVALDVDKDVTDGQDVEQKYDIPTTPPQAIEKVEYYARSDTLDTNIPPYDRINSKYEVSSDKGKAPNSGIREDSYDYPKISDVQRPSPPLFKPVPKAKPTVSVRPKIFNHADSKSGVSPEGGAIHANEVSGVNQNTSPMTPRSADIKSPSVSTPVMEGIHVTAKSRSFKKPQLPQMSLAAEDEGLDTFAQQSSTPSHAHLLRNPGTNPNKDRRLPSLPPEAKIQISGSSVV